jgi:hypothetical protein
VTEPGINRARLHNELEQHIRALTDVRDNTEYVERRTTNASGKRSRRRMPHHVTLPPLLTALNDALVPAVTSDTTSSNTAGGFESRPAADLEPAAVHRDITAAATWWAHELGVTPGSPHATLRALTTANPTDEQLQQLVRHAAHWVERAQQAAGETPTERVLANPCPYCYRPNALAISGDLESARCTRCGTRWDIDTIGLLAQMLKANQHRETMISADRCWMPDCTARGPHTVHADNRGRTWGDTCELVAESPC